MQRRGQRGRVIEVQDEHGGIFSPVPGKMMRPAYTWGPKGRKVVADTFLFQCPVTAIPQEVFELLILWRDCRYLRLPPPVVTPLLRTAFVTFETEMRAIEGQQSNPEHAAALAVGAMVKVMGGR